MRAVFKTGKAGEARAAGGGKRGSDRVAASSGRGRLNEIQRGSEGRGVHSGLLGEERRGEDERGLTRGGMARRGGGLKKSRAEVRDFLLFCRGWAG
jgi:hypothetical protein